MASKINFRYAHDRRSYKFTAKEQDEARTIAGVSCVGLYYYGARYLDAKYSKWLSTDPAVGEYIPQAPVNGEARKHNQNLPGMGGIFNIVNLQLYHYAGNNPVKYVDPDGREENTVVDTIKLGIKLAQLNWLLYLRSLILINQCQKQMQLSMQMIYKGYLLT